MTLQQVLETGIALLQGVDPLRAAGIQPGSWAFPSPRSLPPPRSRGPAGPSGRAACSLRTSASARPPRPAPARISILNRHPPLDHPRPAELTARPDPRKRLRLRDRRAVQEKAEGCAWTLRPRQ